MSERLPLPRLEGPLGSAPIGDDFPFTFPSYAGSIVSVELTLFEPSNVDPVVVEIRRAGGAALVAVTIPVGDRSAIAAVPANEIAAGEALALRLTDSGNGDARGLGGWLDVEVLAFATPSSGDLTTVAAVKQYQGISGSDQDALIQSLVTEVSRKIERYIGRDVAVATIEAEAHDGTGATDAIALRRYPVIEVEEVAIDGEVLDEEAFELEVASGVLYYQPDGRSAPWPAGRRNVRVTYEAGFVEVPADLHGAARLQVVWELKRTKAHGGRLGERSTVIGDGGTAQYLVDDWAPGVLEVLDRYKAPRLAVV